MAEDLDHGAYMLATAGSLHLRELAQLLLLLLLLL